MSKFTKFGLTHSKMSKYLRCGFAYDCHYNKKIRPIMTGSALLFGVGIDEGLNNMLMKSKIKPMDAYKLSCRKYELGTVEPSRYDYDKYLVSDKAKEQGMNFLTSLGYKGDLDLDSAFKVLFDIPSNERKKKQKIALDYIARIGLEAKAELIFKEYKKQVIPKIKKVLAVQKASETGILDIKAIWEDDKTYIIDNKTSSMAYSDDSTEYSVQLTLYAIEEKCDNIMFIVIPKKPELSFNKVCSVCKFKATGSHRTCNNEIEDKSGDIVRKMRCGGEWNTKVKAKITIQFVPGKVTKKMKKASLGIKEGVQKAIDNKIFVCNFANCGNQFGRPCEYRDLYWKGDMTGLKKVKFKNK